MNGSKQPKQRRLFKQVKDGPKLRGVNASRQRRSMEVGQQLGVEIPF